MNVSFTINGVQHDAEVRGADSLLNVLRNELALPGSKNACEQGECGSCSVVLDGALVCSCLVMAVDCADADIHTVEGMSDEGELHPVQKAMVDCGAVQCGFCTPGFVVAAGYFLDSTDSLTVEDLREEMSGNICRCTGYGAIMRALESLVGGDEQ